MEWIIIAFLLAVSLVTALIGLMLGKVRRHERAATDSVRCGYASDLARIPRPFALLSLRPGIALELYGIFETIHFTSVTEVSVTRVLGGQMIRVRGCDSFGNERAVKIVADRDVRTALSKWFPEQWTE